MESAEKNIQLEDRVSESHTLRLNRNPVLFSIGKSFAWSIVKTRSYKNYEIPPETTELMKRQKKYKDIVIYYSSPHRCMWETVGIPYAISWHGGEIPLIMMGNNLVKNETGFKERVLKYVLDYSGVVTVEREINPRAAVPIIISDITKILQSRRNVLIFPEGTRSKNGLVGNFAPAGFEGLAKAVSAGVEAYVVNVNVDYSKLIEMETFAAYNELKVIKPLMLNQEFAGLTESQKLASMRDLYTFTHFATEEKYLELEAMVKSGNPDFKSQWETFEDNQKYTFKWSDWKLWKTFIGDTEISFGKPIYVEKSSDKHYRGILAKQSRDACMDLIKIHKINVLSEAIVRMNPSFGAPINNNELYSNIIDVKKDLSRYEDKFRNFSMLTRPEEISETTSMMVDSRLMEGYKIYANQISHLYG